MKTLWASFALDLLQKKKKLKILQPKISRAPTILISAWKNFLLAWWQAIFLRSHIIQTLHCIVFLKRPVWFLYKALSFIRALIILGIKVLMFNHRQATGHELTAALRQQSAWSSQGTPVRGEARVCVQNCKINRKKEKERKQGDGVNSRLGCFQLFIRLFRHTSPNCTQFQTNRHGY